MSDIFRVEEPAQPRRFVPQGTPAATPVASWLAAAQRNRSLLSAALAALPEADAPAQLRPLITLKTEFESAGFFTAVQGLQRYVPPQVLPDPEPKQRDPLVTLRTEFESAGSLSTVLGIRRAIASPPQVAPDPEPTQLIPKLITLRTEFESAGYIAAHQAPRRAYVPPQVLPDPEPTQGSRPWTQRVQFESGGYLAAALAAKRVHQPPQMPPDPEPTQGSRPTNARVQFESAGYLAAALVSQRVNVPPQTAPDPEPRQFVPLVTLRREDSEPWLAAVIQLRSGVLQPPPDPEPRQAPPLVTLRTQFESSGFLAAVQRANRAAVPPQVAPDPEPTQGARPVYLRTEFDSASALAAWLRNRAGVLQPPEPDRQPPAPILVLSRTQAAFDSGWLHALARGRASVTPSPIDSDASVPRVYVYGVAATARSMDGVLAVRRTVPCVEEWTPPLSLRPLALGVQATAFTAFAAFRPPIWVALEPELPIQARAPVFTGRAASPWLLLPRPLLVLAEEWSPAQRVLFVATAAKGSDWLAALRRVAVPIVEVDATPQRRATLVATFRAESAGFLAGRRIVLPQEEPFLLVRASGLVLGAQRDALGWFAPLLRRQTQFQPEEFAHLQRWLLRWFPGGSDANRIFDLIGFALGLRRYQGAARATSLFSGTARTHRESD